MKMRGRLCRPRTPTTLLALAGCGLREHIPARHAFAKLQIGGLDELCGSEIVPALDVAQQPAECGSLFVGQSRQSVLDADCNRALIDFAMALPACPAGRACRQRLIY